MANYFDTDNCYFLMGRMGMSYEKWKAQKDMEVAALDKVIAHLTQLRDATSISSFPGGLSDFGLRKKQAKDWVAGEAASSKVYEPGMEDCGK